jgi:hypothetical protein
VLKTKTLTKAEKLQKNRELLKLTGDVVDVKYLTEHLKYRIDW